MFAIEGMGECKNVACNVYQLNEKTWNKDEFVL